jgi:RND family efflux transporter MFP subunit
MAARGNLASAKEQLDDAQREVEQVRSLQSKGAESGRSLERAISQLETRRAQMQQAKGSVLQCEDRLAATKLTAPFSGVVTQLDAELGEYVNPGARVLVLADVSSLALEVPVSEAEIASRGAGGLTFAATVRGAELATEVEWFAREADEGSTTFPVRLRVANPNAELRPGESVEVVVRAGKAAARRVVPTSAVRWANGRAYVLVIEAETIRSVDVSVGEDVAGGVAVEGPIEVGQVVVAGGPANLIAGDRVRSSEAD